MEHGAVIRTILLIVKALGNLVGCLPYVGCRLVGRYLTRTPLLRYMTAVAYGESLIVIFKKKSFNAFSVVLTYVSILCNLGLQLMFNFIID